MRYKLLLHVQVLRFELFIEANIKLLWISWRIICAFQKFCKEIFLIKGTTTFTKVSKNFEIKVKKSTNRIERHFRKTNDDNISLDFFAQEYILVEEASNKTYSNACNHLSFPLSLSTNLN